MKRQKKTYTLRLFDEALLSFSTEVDALGTFTLKVLDVNRERQSALPMSILLDPSDENVFVWLSSRTIPKNRQFVEKICEWSGVRIDDTMAIIDICKGLSVNDAFWVDDGTHAGGFDDINLYDNQLDETLATMAFYATTYRGASSAPHPSSITIWRFSHVRVKTTSPISSTGRTAFCLPRTRRYFPLWKNAKSSWESHSMKYPAPVGDAPAHHSAESLEAREASEKGRPVSRHQSSRYRP